MRTVILPVIHHQHHAPDDPQPASSDVTGSYNHAVIYLQASGSMVDDTAEVLSPPNKVSG